ncbi:MAG: hypothetical protein WD934_03090 [Gemmatimonadales bacterium]
MARGSVILGLALLMACGGDDAAPAPGTPPEAATSALDQAVATEAAATDSVTRQDPGLVREVFSYSGAGRDPFVSLITSGAVKPEPSDLRIVGIAYDARYPQRSVATLRDRSDGKRYTMQVGDQAGRVRVQAIREREVVLIIEEFGLERQMVLTLERRTQEVNP